MNLPTNETSQQVPADYFGIRIPFLECLGVVPEYVAMAAAARSSLSDPSGEAVMHHSGAITIDMTVSFMRPSSGTIVVEGSVLKSGKSINYCEAVILNAAGEVTAKSSGTFMLRR